MPRRSLGPRLYLDKTRGAWVIRDGRKFIRTGTADRIEADGILAQYKVINTVIPIPRGPQFAGIVYFITAAYPDFPVKIGFTQSMAAVRMAQLQAACPYALYFIGHRAGTAADERRLHAQFDHLRLRGEWFKRAPDLMAHISSTCSNVAELVA